MNSSPPTAAGPANSPLAEIEIRRSLDAALASEGFVRSERMARFLRHVVESALHSRPDDLKEQAIGRMVFDRAQDYDPKEDPVVRNEARRLRGKLEQLYENPPAAMAVRIEVPRGGYAPRFSALRAPPVPPVPIAAPAAVPVAVPRLARLAVVAGVLGMALAGTFFLLSDRDPAYVYTKLKPLTGEAASELHPAFDRTGQRLAYSSNALGSYDIFVLSGSRERIRVTDHPAPEFHPTWSPDGSRVAFARVQEAGFEIIVKSLASREERVVAQVGNLIFGRPTDDATQIFGNVGPAWSPSSDWLAITNGGSALNEGRAIHLVSAASGEDKKLTHPATSQDDLDPAFSPDGRMLAFCRWQTNSSSDIFLVSTAGGAERRLTNEKGDFRGLAWMPDGENLLASSNRSGLSGLWLVSLRDGRMRPLQLTSSNARDPAVAPGGRRIAYSDYRLQSEIWEVRLDSGEQRPLIQANRENHSAQYSPNGKQVAFVSDRTGSWEIWIADASGQAQRQITRFEGPMVGSPRWSPDSSQLAFDARPEGRSAVYITRPDGPWPLKPFLNNAFEEKMPSWSLDGKTLYFNSNRGGPQQLWSVRLASPDGATLVTRDVVTDSYEGPGGGTVYFANRDQGLWALRPPGGAPLLIPGLEQRRLRRLWTVNEQGIWFLQTQPGEPALWLYRFRDRIEQRLLALQGPVSFETPSLSVSPDSSRLLFSRRKESQSQIMSMEMSRP